MALITVAQLSILSGDRPATRRFLLEAEKLIRIRGLNRRKSRKVRLLHHCYVYERIFFETTSFSATEALQQHEHIRKAIESSGASSYSRDELSFRLPPAVENLEANMLRVKDQELGENDLHLQFPGQWPSSQYEEIFGLPETYLFLVSLILRLAREKNGGLEDDRPSTLSVKNFTNRAKAIERCILQYKRPGPRQNAALEHFIDAIHHALIIYFYRNIHDIDASMLQGKVRDVQNALQAYDRAITGEGFACVRLVWPAFIAACEAETPEVQTWFAEWFENASQQSGLRLFDTSSTEVERVWHEKRREPAPPQTTTGSVIDVF
nr:hypothetical protein CFP56_38916 [Quercus suber]